MSLTSSVSANDDDLVIENDFDIDFLNENYNDDDIAYNEEYFSDVPPEIINRGDPEFRSHFQSYNSRLFHNPYSYFLPNNAKQVAQAILYSRFHRKRLTIKSGGHSCEALSSANNSVVVDMSRMKTIDLSLSKRQITVQSGVNWMEVYNKTVPYGLATAGGSCPTVNVGGLVTGGGANYLSPRFGYACDNVISMTVVTADGRIRTCSPYRHSDLFWAMRGGGHGGLAILVDVTLQLHSIEPKLFRGAIRIPFADFAKGLQFIDSYARQMDQMIYLNVFAGMKLYPSPSGRYARTSFFYNGDPVVGQQEFNKYVEAFQKVLPNVTASVQPLANFVEILSAIQDPPVQRSFTRGRMIDSWTVAGTEAAASFFDNTTVPEMKNKNDTTASIFFEMYFHGGKMNEKSRNYNAFVHRSATWSMSIALNYQSAENDQVFSTWDSKVAQKMLSISDYIYQNYPDNNVPDAYWEKAYYAENYRKLQLVKFKYDPFNFFNYPQSIRPIWKPKL